MNTQPIMVQMRNRDWTLSAMHLASAIARNRGTTVVLMRMIQVQHVQWLGTDLGYERPSLQELRDHDEYRATAEDYGVPFTIQTFQYVTLPEALTEAANYVNAQIVFATLPKNPFVHWRRFQMWLLRARLERDHRQLCTLEGDRYLLAYAPYVIISESNKRTLKYNQVIDF